MASAKVESSSVDSSESGANENRSINIGVNPNNLPFAGGMNAASDSDNDSGRTMMSASEATSDPLVPSARHGAAISSSPPGAAVSNSNNNDPGVQGRDYGDAGGDQGSSENLRINAHDYASIPHGSPTDRHRHSREHGHGHGPPHDAHPEVHVPINQHEHQRQDRNQIRHPQDHNDEINFDSDSDTVVNSNRHDRFRVEHVHHADSRADAHGHNHYRDPTNPHHMHGHNDGHGNVNVNGDPGNVPQEVQNAVMRGQQHGFTPSPSPSPFSPFTNHHHHNPQHNSGSNPSHGTMHGSTHSSTNSYSPYAHGPGHVQSSFSLPAELKSILQEVARYGKCSSLPWTASGISSFNAKRPKQSSSRSARKRHKRKLIRMNAGNNSSGFGTTNGGSNSAANMNSTGLGQNHFSKFSEGQNQLADDNSSIRSNASKKKGGTFETTGMTEGFKESPSGAGSGSVSIAPSHADSNSIVETGSLASHGSKRSVDLSVSTRSAQQGFRMWKFYKDQSCASSCSESVSSAGAGSTLSVPSSTGSMGPLCLSLPFRTLRGALRLAVALVLEYSYKHRGGYKLSPAEKRRFEVLQQANPSKGIEKNANYHHPSQTDVAFMERRMRLLKMLGGGKSARPSSGRVASSDGGFTSDTSFDNAARNKTSEDFAHSTRYGPPFTIQRVAEILLMPERFYVQTHKLCNALEKLLLVTSPSSAFGGMTGGDTSQNRREEREMAALALKKGRDETQQMKRSQRLLTKPSTSEGNDPIIQMNVSVETPKSKRISPANNNQPAYPPMKDPISNEGVAVTNTNNTSPNNEHRRLTPNPLMSEGRMIGEITGETVGSPESDSALQSVYNTYSHSHNLGVQNQGFSGRSDSFPPGDLGVAKSVTDDTLRAHNVNVNANSPSNVVLAGGLHRPPSPSLFTPGQGLNQLMNNDQSNDMQGHLDPSSILRAGQNVMEIVIDPASGGNTVQNVQSGVSANDVAYLVDQVEQGRSSASNSDFDSESDDISFDDSASDRSDGSDIDASGSGLSDTAARVMALNRMQQQHRREQYLQDRALRQMQPFQSPPDSEYQSGDSVDSTMAEDSCGSDSSSSDFTD